MAKKLIVENKGLRVITLADEGKELHLAPQSKLTLTEETAHRLKKLYPRELEILEEVVNQLQKEIGEKPADEHEAAPVAEEEGEEDDYDFELPDGQKVKLEDQTVKGLRELAETLGVDLQDAKKKDDIIAAIREHLEDADEEAEEVAE